MAYFGEIHPEIIANLDLKEKNVCGFEIFLKNIKETKKKMRLNKKSYKASRYQKSERDFAFVIDRNFNAINLTNMIYKLDYNLIKKVIIFDAFEGGNLPKEKKSIAVNVTFQSMDKTLSENDINQLSQKIMIQ